MSVVATVQGRVEEPVRLQGQPGVTGILAQYVVKVVIQSADYSSGFALANVLTATGANVILGAVVLEAKIAAGTALFGFGMYDRANAKVRFFSAIATQTSATDYTAANGDIFSLLVTVQ